MTNYTTDSNQQISLGALIKMGGEGSVYHVAGSRNLIAKIYHAAKGQDHELGEKLRVMIAHPPKDPMQAHGHMSIAWPQTCLFDNGRFAGFMMPRVHSAAEILTYYNPTEREKRYSSITWKDLFVISRNLAAAVSAVHVDGYVVGDMNEGNIFVNNEGMVTLIDTDSFQVRDPLTGHLYRCKVGKGEFTPAELQGQDLNSVER